MERFSIRLADHAFGIECRSLAVRDFFADYIVPDTETKLSASVTDNELREIIASSPSVTPETAEITGLHRTIAEKLPDLGGFVFHGAAICVNGIGYVFTAPSGTGKSTHIRLWREYLGDAVGIVNGDKPVITVGENGIFVHGTPWAGKERWQRNRSVPLGGICLLHRDNVCHAHVADADESIPFLLTQIYLPRDPASVGKTMTLMDTVLKNVPVISLYCDISENAVKCGFEKLCSADYDTFKAENENQRSHRE